MAGRFREERFNPRAGFSSAGAPLETPLIRIALAVREAVQASDRTKWGETVEMGADGTPTKWIDDLAEKVLLKELDREGLDGNVLSEEAGFIDREGKQLLVADPVDGTHNAVRGNAALSCTARRLQAFSSQSCLICS